MHKLIESSINQDVTINLRFEGGAWASMTFQEKNSPGHTWWNVVISSDWGNWSYRWSYSGMGNISIFEFMSEPRSYFKEKFMIQEERLFDPMKSCTLMRKRIREELPWLNNKEKNEEFMYQIKELEQYDNDRDFTSNISSELHEILGEETWHYLVFEKSDRSYFFFDKIFPKFYPLIKKINKDNEKKPFLNISDVQNALEKMDKNL